MNNNELIEILQNTLSETKQTLDYAETQLAAKPEGSLRVIKCHGKTEYLCRKKTSETNGQYLRKNSDKLIRQLEEKAYLETLQSETLKKIEILEQTINNLSQIPDPEKLYFDMQPEKRHLIEPYRERIEKVDSNELKKWQKEQKNHKGFDNHVFYVTQNGEKVRSKSEVIIADRLKAAQVPYHYEYQRVFLNEDDEFTAWFPDFLALNKRTGKEYYWEHFGMMDNAEYCASAQYKVEFYAKNGIVLGKNLIVTTESSQHQLNTRYIDILIEQFLK